MPIDHGRGALVGLAIAAFWVVVIVAVLAFLSLLFASQASAHSWYNTACCSEKDCRPAERGEVEFTPKGWYVPEYNQTFKPDEWAVHRSQDHQMHLCIAYGRVRCLYIPDPGI